MPPGDGDKKRNGSLTQPHIFQKKARWGRDGGLGEGNPLCSRGRGFPSPRITNLISPYPQTERPMLKATTDTA